MKQQNEYECQRLCCWMRSLQPVNEIPQPDCLCDKAVTSPLTGEKLGDDQLPPLLSVFVSAWLEMKEHVEQRGEDSC
ncbi:hypothetical protein NQZ68_001397 [Dissostichus eleginoides]|nr:hypothetical protein NQZ68_001397 [Dissostichus eleginoides]